MTSSQANTSYFLSFSYNSLGYLNNVDLDSNIASKFSFFFFQSKHFILKEMNLLEFDSNTNVSVGNITITNNTIKSSGFIRTIISLIFLQVFST